KGMSAGTMISSLPLLRRLTLPAPCGRRGITTASREIAKRSRISKIRSIWASCTPCGILYLPVEQRNGRGQRQDPDSENYQYSPQRHRLPEVQGGATV